jgi:predicted PurR-regulated permease PerM
MNQQRQTGVPSWLWRSAAVSWRLLVVAAAVGVVGFLLVYLRLIVLPVIVALFLTTLLAPPANWLRARGWPPLGATWAVMLAAVLLIAGGTAALAPQIGPQFGTLRGQVATGLDDVQRWLREGPLHFSDAQLSSLLERARQEAQSNSTALTRGLLSGATLAVEVLTGALLSIVLTFFFVKDGNRIGDWFARHAGSHAEELRAIGRRAFDTLGAYLRGVATVGLIDGLFIGIGLAVVGVPLAVPLAFLVFLGAFFPIVGAFLSGLVAALVALVSEGLVAALVIVGITVAVQQLEGHVLAPVVLGRAVKLHPAVILLALAGGGVVGGIAGAALAVPAVAVVGSVGSYLRDRDERADQSALGADGRPGVPSGGQGEDRPAQRQSKHEQQELVVEPRNQPVGDRRDDRGGGDRDDPRPDDPPGDPPADR